MRPENNGVKASVYLAMRNELLNALREIDLEITQALGFKTSKRAAHTARNLFAERARVADELSEYGIEVDPHPAVAGRNQ